MGWEKTTPNGNVSLYSGSWRPWHASRAIHTSFRYHHIV